MGGPSKTLYIVYYYMHHGLWRHVQMLCTDSISRQGVDSTLSFWKAAAMLMENLREDAIREFNILRTKRDVDVACMHAMMYAHQQADLVDEEAINTLKSMIAEKEGKATENCLTQAAAFYWCVGRHDLGRRIIQKVIDENPDNSDAKTILGWIDLTSSRQILAERSRSLFPAPGHNTDNLLVGLLGRGEGHLGHVKWLEDRGEINQALNIVAEIIVDHPEFAGSYVERARLLTAAHDFDGAVEAAQSTLGLDGHNLAALKLLTVHLLAREGSVTGAATRCSDLLQAMERFEPRNAKLFLSMCRSISRLATSNQAVLQQTLAMIDRARKIEPNNPDILEEWGFQLMLNADYTGAQKAFSLSLEHDESRASALCGSVECQIKLCQWKDAEEQVEFLNETLSAMGKTPRLLYLTAILRWHRDGDLEKSFKLLNDAIKSHLTIIDGLPLGPDFFYHFDPPFLLNIASQYLSHCSPEPLGESQPPPPSLRRAVRLLEIVCKHVPGHLDGLLALARTKYLLNSSEVAEATCRQALRLNPTVADGHLLMAEIACSRGDYRVASQSLDRGLSHNFSVRESPSYFLIKSKIQSQSGENEEALKTITGAMSLPGVKRQANMSSKRARAIGIILPHLRVAVFLALARCQIACNQYPEAAMTLQDGRSEFASSPDLDRIEVAEAQLHLAQGDVDSAIKMLKEISSDRPHFVLAHTVLADIYLEKRHNKALYAQCYKEVVQAQPSVHALLLLGEAYLAIHEPEKAVTVFESAHKKSPKDTSLALKIGSALTLTHDYSRAVQYHEDAVANDPTNPDLLRQLATLYLKLKKVGNTYDKTQAQVDRAKAVLDEALSHAQDEAHPLPTMKADVRALLLLARVHEANGQASDGLKARGDARDLQANVVHRVKAEEPEQMRAESSLAASICFDLGDKYTALGSHDKALEMYKMSLQWDEGNAKAVLQLARVFLSRLDFDGCQQHCSVLLRLDPSNEDAAIMLADIKFQRNEFDAATFHFQQLLEKRPDHYLSLYRLIILLKKAGKLSDAPRFLEMATHLSKHAQSAGLAFCKGLYARFTMDPIKAVKEFNIARKDPEWGEKATLEMIEVYINPDNEYLWESKMDDETSLNSLRQAEKLIFVRGDERVLKVTKDLPQQTRRTVRVQILEAYTMMLKRNKQITDKAINLLVGLLAVERDCVPAILALAVAHLFLKQTPKARNQLKRVAKLQFNAIEADAFEGSWLTLAHVYFQSGKYSQATELCKKCLEHNKSCGKAHELLGRMMEKEQTYQTAAEHYQQAWVLQGERNPKVGYELAFNYLKAKRYVEAIDIAHTVLKNNPDYPKIQKDILQKARKSLRP